MQELLKLKKNTLLFFLFSILGLLSCNENAKPNTKATDFDSTQIDSAKIEDAIDQSANNENESNQFDSISSINFDLFSLNFHNFHFSGIENKQVINEDTVVIETIIGGEEFEGIMLTFNSEVLYDFNIEQRYETSVTLMAEGPHCDLTDWEHFVSEWQTVSKNHLEEYFLYSYNEKERQLFPNVSKDALIKAAKKHCGDEWSEQIKTISTPNDYPCGVSISRYFLKISGKRMDNGKAIQKLIIIVSPMGC